MPERPLIRVSVVCAWPGRVFLKEVSLPATATVADAVEASGIREAWPELDLRDGRLGIFSRKATAGAGLRDGDRVEIYRPLTIDPKEARRKRARDG